MPKWVHGNAAQGLTPEYRSWQSMRQRCADNEDMLYGGAGVRVCERWREFNNFLADMGPRPSAAHSLDRYPDGRGNYEPGNVRWATSKEQNRNRRDNRLIAYGGRIMACSEAAEKYGIPYITLVKRLNAGWTISASLTTAVRSKRPNGEGPRYAR